jgi:DNA invertase Pin-like site-specific DNA recombinase
MDSTVAAKIAYVRRSTFDQENEHQLDAIRDWLDTQGWAIADVEFLEETASGASRNREEFRELCDRIEAGGVDHVVVWELSRIAREGELAQRFFNLCEDNDVHVHITSGSIREIKPDGTNRFVADILAAVYAEERRTLIRRTKYGQQRALDNDKWVGKPPLGFTTDDDGYLIANVDLYQSYNPDRDGFYAIEGAMETLDEDRDASYNAVAGDLQCSRPALTNAWKDEQKRAWYLDREADDDRVAAALAELEEAAVR